MNNLPMTLQLDNQFKRQYNLLQFIRTHQNKNLTLSDLSQELGTSKPTLRKDIDIINSSLPTNDFQLTYNDQGFLQITQQEISVDSVITRLAKDTTIYRMMDLLLHDKAYTTE
ncbi:HTH domain-containing protein [Enterococcus sp. DIV2381]